MNVKKAPVLAMVLLTLTLPLFTSELEIYIQSEEELTVFLNEAATYPEEKLTVYLEPGVYAVPVVMPPNTSLIGAGPGQTFLEGVQGTEAVLTLSYNNTIRNLEILMPETDNIYAVFGRAQKDIHLENVRIRGNQKFGVYLESCGDIKIINCSLQDHDYGVFIKDSNDFLVQSSLFIHNNFSGLYLDRSEGTVCCNLFAFNPGHGIFSHGTYLYYRRLFAQRRYEIQNNLFFHNGPEKRGHMKNLITDESNIILQELDPPDPDTGIPPGLSELNEKYGISLPLVND